MRRSPLIGALLCAFALQTAPALAQTAPKPTIVLVHGAFADASSWQGVIQRLRADGFAVVAAANPLRSVLSDSAEIGALVDSIDGPVVLVGHSYGGAVISNAATGHENVRALVFVAAFAPDAGETAAALAGQFPGSTLGETLDEPVALPEGGSDLYIRQDAFPLQFAHDVPSSDAALMAATQRPITLAALNEASGPAGWKSLPSWFVYGDGDRNIPAEGLAFMAERAGSKRTIVVPGASHVVMVSHPEIVASLIIEASANLALTTH